MHRNKENAFAVSIESWLYVESVTTSRGRWTNFDKEFDFLSSLLPHPEVAQQNLK